MTPALISKFDDKTLLKTVKGFRRGVLGRKKPNLMCFAVCAPMSAFLGIGGIENKMKEVCIVQGPRIYYHWYLELKDGRILDPTASQFVAPDGTPMPDIYLGERPVWYQFMKSKKKTRHNL